MNENKEKTAGNLANSVVEGYDYSVAVRMSGRAGAYSPTGGKGNAFEVMYSDKKNLSNLLKPDTTTTLTNSSTARQVDLVTKKGNRIIERIQCKDTPSAKGTMDTIKRVQNGQYRTTQLVGTSESAAAFNAKAPSQDDKNRMYQNLDYSGRYHSDWCSMIYARLLAARNLLCDDGVIFISIDDNEQANLKKICDEVFGERNFVNCFIWNCSTAGGIRPKFASKTHEYILCYAKNKTCLDMFFAPLSGEAIKMYREKDERGLYRDKDFVFKNKSTNANQKYEIICPDGERVRPKDGYIYRFVRERFEQAKEEGLVTFKRTKTGPLVDQNGDQAHWNIYIKKYLGDAMGAPSTLIPKEAVSIYNAGTQCVQELFDGKRVFENVKPVNVIQYFINMAAKDGDIVMDFFSGSATTAHAVMQTEADKNIDLHYILVQIPQECDKKSEAYKAGYKTICEIGKERIRRAAEKIKRENGCENRDFGFRVLRLDESNMEDVYYMPEEYTQEMLCGLETNIKPDRTDLDLLFACLTEWGLLLSKPYSSEKIGGYTVHYYDGKELAACFNENISETVIRKIAGQHPRRAVFCDASFSDSAAKINMSELFRTISPETQIKVI